MPNCVLAVFAPEVRRFLMHHALTRPVSAGEMIYPDNTPVTHAIFPSRGISSLMGERTSGSYAEKASIGREGFLAAFMHRSLIMGACRRGVGFFEKPAQGDPPRRFSVAEMV